MPRRERIQYPGAWHHITSRGIDHCKTFVTDQDRRSFLYLVGDLGPRFGVETHAYCLMGNHYHLLLRTPRPNLSRAMQRLDSLYTQAFNKRHDRDGPLFRGRFGSRLIESETYLARVARYIHRNPCGDGLATELDKYRWSSYPAYVGRIRPPAWLRMEVVLQSFDSDHSFRAFVETGAEDGELSKLLCSSAGVIGTAEFASRVRARADLESTSMPQGLPLEEIEALVLAEFEVSTGFLRTSVRGQRNVARMAAIALCHRYGRATFEELADRYGFATASSAASAVHRLAEFSKRDQPTQTRLRALTARLDGV